MLHISTSKLQFLIFEELQVTYLDFKVTSYDFFMKSYDFFSAVRGGGVPVPLNGYFDTPALTCQEVLSDYLNGFKKR